MKKPEYQNHIDVPPGSKVWCHFEENATANPPLYRLRIVVNETMYLTEPSTDKAATEAQADSILAQLCGDGEGTLVEYTGKHISKAGQA